jgi:uncharacterized membrane protein SirB2
MAGPAEDMDYLIVKTVHQSAVALSFAGFFARGLGALAGAPWVGARAAKTLPHIVDSVLLLSALWLAWSLRLNPAEVPWLLAKIIGLLAYIGIGMVALKPGRPPALRAFAWLAALAVFGYIVSVALTKNPLGFIAWL